jgi:putative addiction module killer protein
MFQIETTEVFDEWLAKQDKRVRLRLATRLDKLSKGLWGDFKAVGASVLELREHFGAGYRIYVTQMDSVLVIALGAGDKSTQQKDIAAATRMAQELKNEH